MNVALITARIRQIPSQIFAGSVEKLVENDPSQLQIIQKTSLSPT
jgi:hypothetical protein